MLGCSSRKGTGNQKLSLAGNLLRDTGAAQRSLWILSPGTHMGTHAGQVFFNFYTVFKGEFPFTG